tara:strand:+ start:1346 stop:2164 length:819 start_codon:yes stop_codon:yes gene_type:complete
MKVFKEEFNKLLFLLKQGIPFSFSRFSDGEVTILRNRKLVLGDGFFVQGDIHGDAPYHVPPNTYPEEERKNFDPSKDWFFNKKLTEAFVYRKQNYFKGIPPQNGGHDKDSSWRFCVDLYGEGDEEHLSFSNVMINDNYRFFIKEMLPLFAEKQIVLVSNENSKLDDLPFKVQKHFPVGPNCMKNDYYLIDACKDWIKEKNIKNHLFLFAASSLSNLLCHELYKDFDNNQYMDIGSSLGPLLKLEGWQGTRTYLKLFWSNPHNPPPQDVDVWN